MSNYQVLVDSSIWIDYFRKGEHYKMDQLIEEDLICTNELILTELIPNLRHQGYEQVAEDLYSIRCIPLTIDWEIIRDYQKFNLQNGINKVGIPDLIILQQIIQNKLTLFTKDKPFRLMKKYLTFELFGD